VARQCHDVDVFAGGRLQRRKTRNDFEDCAAGATPGWVKSDFVTSASQSEQVAAPHSLGAPLRRLLPRQSLKTAQKSKTLYPENRSSPLASRPPTPFEHKEHAEHEAEERAYAQPR
jgi:hypothetical protein